MSGFGPGDTIRLMDEPASGLDANLGSIEPGTLTIDSFGTGTLVDLQGLTGTYRLQLQ